MLAIDNDINRVNAISDHVQRALCLDVRDFQALSSAVSPSFDEAIISIGEELESSILCTLYMKRIGIPIIRAKASSEEHAEILKSIGATSIVFPEIETADRLALKILNPNMIDIIPLTLDYRIVDISAPETFFGQSLENLNFRKKYRLLVIAIKKPNQDLIFLPGPEYIIHPEDVLMVIGRKEDILSIKPDAWE